MVGHLHSNQAGEFSAVNSNQIFILEESVERREGHKIKTQYRCLDSGKPFILDLGMSIARNGSEQVGMVEESSADFTVPPEFFWISGGGWRITPITESISRF